jgi:hypothetical protein
MEMAFCRPLKEVVPRIEHLGFTLDHVQREYANCAESWREECQGMADEEEESVPDVMTFAEFCAFATAYPLETLDETFISSLMLGTRRKSEAHCDITVTSSSLFLRK